MLVHRKEKMAYYTSKIVYNLIRIRFDLKSLFSD